MLYHVLVYSISVYSEMSQGLKVPREVNWNLTKHLELYSDIYPGYFPIEWIKHEEGYINFQEAVDTLYFNMPLFIGIPQAILNLFVFLTVIVITNHPRLAITSSMMVNKTNDPQHLRRTQIVPRYERHAIHVIISSCLKTVIWRA
jgi:hypothetical protein